MRSGPGPSCRPAGFLPPLPPAANNKPTTCCKLPGPENGELAADLLCFPALGAAIRCVEDHLVRPPLFARGGKRAFAFQGIGKRVHLPRVGPMIGNALAVHTFSV